MTPITQAPDTSDKPDYDSPWKEALERLLPGVSRAAVPGYLPAEIDWSKGIQFLDKGIPADRARGQDHPAHCG